MGRGPQGAAPPSAAGARGAGRISPAGAHGPWGRTGGARAGQASDRTAHARHSVPWPSRTSVRLSLQSRVLLRFGARGAWRALRWGRRRAAPSRGRLSPSPPPPAARVPPRRPRSKQKSWTCSWPSAGLVLWSPDSSVTFQAVAIFSTGTSGYQIWTPGERGPSLV